MRGDLRADNSGFNAQREESLCIAEHERRMKRIANPTAKKAPQQVGKLQ